MLLAQIRGILSNFASVGKKMHFPFEGILPLQTIEINQKWRKVYGCKYREQKTDVITKHRLPPTCQLAGLGCC